ncbi:MAG: cell division protein FtsZ [Paludibacter sp.]|jgi:cell division protein FtsZ|nr:cell division protein FtsZ [Paludibacter sp.]
MTEDMLPIELPLIDPAIIKVIGVGGGGGNAVNHMYKQGIRDVTFVVCNTDNQALKTSPVPVKIQLGLGLGAGGKPEVARDAAEESIESIQKVLRENTKMVFITAGMGGGTGTGASPVVARAAHELGILTVGIVTIPFAFEGAHKIRQALQGVAELSEHVDALLVINNQKLTEIYSDLELSNAFAKADDVLTNAARGIAEIITVPGYINTDFADVYTILSKGNVAIMNTGYAKGEKRITNAIKDALNSPLLNTNDVSGASKVLLNLYCSSQHQIRMEEVREINDFMASIGDDIQVIWGATFDDNLGEDVKITLIATGYDVSDIPGMPKSVVKKKVQEARQPEVLINFETGVEETINRPEEKPADPIADAMHTYYPSPEDEKSEEPETEPWLVSPETIILEDQDENGFETISLEELDNDEVLKKAEEIPAWKRRLLGRR